MTACLGYPNFERQTAHILCTLLRLAQKFLLHSVPVAFQLASVLSVRQSADQNYRLLSYPPAFRQRVRRQAGRGRLGLSRWEEPWDSCHGLQLEYAPLSSGYAHQL